MQAARHVGSRREPNHAHPQDRAARRGRKQGRVPREALPGACCRGIRCGSRHLLERLVERHPFRHASGDGPGHLASLPCPHIVDDGGGEQISECGVRLRRGSEECVHGLHRGRCQRGKGEAHVVGARPPAFDRGRHTFVEPAGQRSVAGSLDEGQVCHLMAQDGLEGRVGKPSGAPRIEFEMRGAKRAPDDPGRRLAGPCAAFRHQGHPNRGGHGEPCACQVVAERVPVQRLDPGGCRLKGWWRVDDHIRRGSLIAHRHAEPDEQPGEDEDEHTPRGRPQRHRVHGIRRDTSLER